MHAIRSSARREAWKYYDGDSRNYNPFAKRSRGSKPTDEEDNLSTWTSADRVPSRLEEDRRTKNEAEYPHPHRAGTAPTNSAAPAQDQNPSSDAPNGQPRDVNSDETPRLSDKTIGGDESSGIKDEPRDLNGVDSNGTTTKEDTKKHGLRNRFFGKHQDDSAVDDADEKKESRRAKWTKSKTTPWGEVKATLFGSWINILLVMVPVSFVVNYLHINGIAIFCIAFVAIIPLAALLSFATEELAMYTGPTLGGLLNATFGNATELIVSVIALAKEEVLIVQTSLIGSMLSNLLLVLGMCFFFGGINRVKQHFNITVAQTAASLLALSIGSLIIPTAFQRFGSMTDSQKSQQGVAPISRGTSVLLLLVYISYLIFQLKTHTEMYNEPSKKSEKRKTGKKEKGDTLMGIARMGAGTAASAGGQVNQANLVQQSEAEDEEEEPTLSLLGAVITLTIATVLIAFCSEFLVSGISAVSEHISQEFIGLILLPIVGNAAEHATAVTVACKDKMDLAIGVAVGSSMQIALLVLPLMVVIGWCGVGHPEIRPENVMSLDFDGFQVAVLFIAVLLVNYLIQDGESHWLEGILLMATYVIIALTSYYYPVNGAVAG